MLNNAEYKRYNRHLLIPGFGLESQLKLKEAKVLVVGAGGLACPMLQYLVAAGVGKIGIVDFDWVDESNLHRQILYSTEDVGQLKVEVAKQKLSQLNEHVNIQIYPIKINSTNALDIINKYDLIADGTDNFPTRYLINDACVLTGKVNVFASIFQFEGQASVFNFLRKDGSRGPNFRDLFPEPPPPGLVPSCAEGGVLGVMPGLLGTIQALEVIKVICEIGEVLDGRLFLFDALDFDTRTLKIVKNPENPLTGDNPTQNELIDYEAFCGLKESQNFPDEIDIHTLKLWMESKDFNLVDVRESHEYEAGQLDAENIPLSSIMENLDEFDPETKTVLYCRSGLRSRTAIKMLRKQGNFDKLINLKGGILAWKKEIDPDIEVL